MALKTDKSLIWNADLNVAGLKRGIADTKGLLAGLSKKVTALDVFAGVGLSATVAFGIVSKKAYEASKEFETAMKEVETISDAVKTNFKGISQAVVDLSTEVPEQATQLTNALYQIVSAGNDGADALAVLKASAKAAVGGVTETETAADGLTTVLNAFGKESTEVNRVADIMFQTVKLGKTTFGELSQNIATAAPLAASANVEFEQLAAAVATLTKQGHPTSVAMTQIRAAILALNDNLGDGWANTLTLQDAMQQLRDAAGGSQVELRNLVPRVEAMSGVLGLTGKNARGAAEDLRAMENSAGSAEEAFRTMVESTENQLAILANNFAAKLKPLGDFILDFVGDITGSINEVVFAAGNEFDRYSNTLENMADVMRKRSTDIKGYISIIEELSEKQERTATEAANLKTAKEALLILLPDVKKEWDDEKTAIENLIIAKEALERFETRTVELMRQSAISRKESLEEQIQQEKERNKEALKIAREFHEKTAHEREVGIENLTKFVQEVKDGTADLENSVIGYTKAYNNEIKEIADSFKSGDIDLDEVTRRVTAIANETILRTSGLARGFKEANKTIDQTNDNVRNMDAELFLVDQSLITFEKRLSGVEDGIKDLGDAAESIELVPKFDPDKELENIEKGFREFQDSSNDLFDRIPKDVQEELQQSWFDPEQTIKALDELSAKIKEKGGENSKILEAIAELRLKAIYKREEIRKLEEENDQKAQAKEERRKKNFNKAVATERENEIARINEDYDQQIKDNEGFIDEIEQLEEARARKLSEAQLRHVSQDFVEQVKDAARQIGREVTEKNLRDYIATLKRMKVTYADYADIILELNEKIKAAEQQIGQIREDKILDLIGGLTNLAAIVSEIDSSAGKMIQTLANSAQVINGIGKAGLDSFTGITGAIGGVLSIGKSLIGLFGGGDEESGIEKALRKFQENLTANLNRLSNALDGLQLKRIIIFGEDDIEVLREMIELTEELADIPITGSTVEEVQAAIQRNIDAKDSLRQLQEELSEILTGTSIPELGATLVDQFIQGKHAVEDFGETIEDVIKNALRNSFERSVITNFVEDWQKEFLRLTESGGGLTSFEINKLRDSYVEMAEAAAVDFEALQQILESAGLQRFGIEDIEQRTGLAGAVKGIQEDTAGLIAGQLTGMRISQIDLLSIAEDNLRQNERTADNTDIANRKLSNIENLMQQLISPDSLSDWEKSQGG